VAARQYAITVGTSAVVLDGTNYRGWILINNSSNTIYLGDSDVTTGTGFPIEAGAVFSPPATVHDTLVKPSQVSRLYGIAAVASNDVRVLVLGPI
jgi:hypothetical protein